MFFIELMHLCHLCSQWDKWVYGELHLGQCVIVSYAVFCHATLVWTCCWTAVYDSQWQPCPKGSEEGGQPAQLSSAQLSPSEDQSVTLSGHWHSVSQCRQMWPLSLTGSSLDTKPTHRSGIERKEDRALVQGIVVIKDVYWGQDSVQPLTTWKGLEMKKQSVHSALPFT